MYIVCIMYLKKAYMKDIHINKQKIGKEELIQFQFQLSFK